MRLIFAGTPQVAADTLERLLRDGGHVVAGVLTRPDAPVGRHRTPQLSPVAALAEANGLPLLKSATAKSPEVERWVRGIGADIAAVVAYGGLIPEPLLGALEHGWVNVHYSLLPRWRGAAPVQHAVMAGDQTTGVSVFELVAELDAGPVYQRVEVPVGQLSAGELLAALVPIGARALLETLDGIAAGTAVPTPQTDAGVSLAPKLTPASARIDWSRPAVEIERQIRGCNPAPMAWTLVNGERFRVLAAAVAGGYSQLGAAGEDGFPGEDAGQGLAPAAAFIGAGQVLVGTGAGRLSLKVVQPAGKRPMPAADWARGLREPPVIDNG
ncbi:MAG: methionyl-tRNA formyltransferase [Propionibacteriaceae bacterium]|jgi:methionyl-tRNA formyltransferase|nr:methionyl-tRNA formyltransferase [Propionibacteriaceae bacterium]